MPGKQPAVVNCPYYRFSTFGQILEEYLKIEEVTVNVMDVDYVRIYLFDLADKKLCRAPGSKAMTVEKSCCNKMQEYIQFVTYRYDNRRTRLNPIPSPAVGHKAFPSTRYGEITYFLHYPPS